MPYLLVLGALFAAAFLGGIHAPPEIRQQVTDALQVVGEPYRDLAGERIPLRTIEKPPSAELAPGQLDSDDLPPYDALDAILEQALEGGLGPRSVRAPPGLGAEQAAAIVRRLDRNEYKRRQAPLVLRVSSKAFGAGRRLPIVHRYAL